MFRTVFKSAIRQAPFARTYSTRARAVQPRKVLVGASLVASALVFLPLASVDNDAGQTSVADDSKSSKIGSHEGKAKFNVDDSSNKPSEIIPEDHPRKSPKKKASEKATEETSARAEKEFAEKQATRENEPEKPKAEKEEPKAVKEETEADQEEATEEGHQSAAYNPETGEINWDCPCLGGMAHGPCGEEFKAAFSCFIYSETEPKGIDCIQKFEGMRTCFRQHPEHYKEELYEDDEPVPSTEDKPQEPKEEAPATEDIAKVA